MIFTDDELKSFHALTEELNEELANDVTEQDKEKLASYIKLMEEKGAMERNVFGLSELLCAMQTSLIAVRNIGLKRDSVLATVLYAGFENGALEIKQIETDFGKRVSRRLFKAWHAFRICIKRILSSRARTSAISCFRLQKTCASYLL